MRKKVICIKDDWAKMLGPMAGKSGTPKKNQIYTAIAEEPCPCGCGAIGYELEEFPAGPLGFWRWRSDWFADVTERPELSNVSIEDLIGQPSLAPIESFIGSSGM